MMSETLESVAIDMNQKRLAEQLFAEAKEQRVGAGGREWAAKPADKNMLETALDAEMSEHLGYDKHDPAGRGSGNSRNGTQEATWLESTNIPAFEPSCCFSTVVRSGRCIGQTMAASDGVDVTRAVVLRAEPVLS
jgi:Transposase, Mutator family